MSGVGLRRSGELLWWRPPRARACRWWDRRSFTPSGLTVRRRMPPCGLALARRIALSMGRCLAGLARRSSSSTTRPTPGCWITTTSTPRTWPTPSKVAGRMSCIRQGGHAPPRMLRPARARRRRSSASLRRLTMRHSLEVVTTAGALGRRLSGLRTKPGPERPRCAASALSPLGRPGMVALEAAVAVVEAAVLTGSGRPGASLTTLRAIPTAAPASLRLRSGTRSRRPAALARVRRLAAIRPCSTVSTRARRLSTGTG
mmetsp:Transcript_107780/g.240559  ORF Transcript_107780/g.240559 Transcript_107780/m.240559 type:complete len:258 (-) Transcript_107780:537-1310(-)